MHRLRRDVIHDNQPHGFLENSHLSCFGFIAVSPENCGGDVELHFAARSWQLPK